MSRSKVRHEQSVRRIRSWNPQGDPRQPKGAFKLRLSSAAHVATGYCAQTTEKILSRYGTVGLANVQALKSYFPFNFVVPHPLKFRVLQCKTQGSHGQLGSFCDKKSSPCNCSFSSRPESQIVHPPPHTQRVVRLI